MFSRLAHAIGNIKVGVQTKKIKVSCVSNKLIKQILRKLIHEGLIRGFGKNFLKPFQIYIYLKYDSHMVSVIKDIKLISTCGHRVYFSFKDVKRAYKTGQFYLLTTDKGIFTI